MEAGREMERKTPKREYTRGNLFAWSGRRQTAVMSHMRHMAKHLAGIGFHLFMDVYYT